MDNEQLSPHTQEALRKVFTYPSPEESFLDDLEKQLQAKLVASQQTVPAYRVYLQTGARWALFAVLLLAFVVGLGAAIEKLIPKPGIGNGFNQQATSGPIINNDGYLGTPQPMVLEVDGKSQTATIGSYCWAKQDQNGGLTRECSDGPALATPVESLVTSAPTEAILRSPYPAAPDSLTLVIFPVDVSQDLAGQTGSELDWKAKPGQFQYLPAVLEPHFQLAFGTGLYALSLQATWKDLGTVTYGFLVQVDRSLPTSTPVYAATVAPPTEPPIYPTEAPMATSTPAQPEGAYATQQADRDRLFAQRATASPFPTALPVQIQSGSPAIAQVERGGLSLEVKIAKDRFVAGEGGQAEITLRNNGPEMLMVRGDGRYLDMLTLLDEYGNPPDPWPVTLSWSMPGGPPYLPDLAPGQVLTETVGFQIPPQDQASLSTYSLWVEILFCRTDPTSSQSPDNLWMHLESGPIPLTVEPPGPANQLKVDWQPDRTGWKLVVSGADGQPVPGPVWGEVGAVGAVANGVESTYSPLPSGQDGQFTGVWGGMNAGMFQGEGKIITNGWVAAQGYITTQFSATIPGSEPPGSELNINTGSALHKTYDTLDQAQAATSTTIVRLGELPAGTEPGPVQVTWPYSGQMQIDQRFRLQDGQWLALSQCVADQTNGCHSDIRYDPEAKPETVAGQPGFVLQHDGWWRLDWQLGEITLELRAPIGSLTLEELLRLAGSIDR